MSKVNMPEPSLYVLFGEDGYPIEAHSDNSSAVNAALDAGGIVEIERYITTDQAEAYANARIREALLPLIQGYVNLLESGRDRIISLGGDCDPVDVMEASDPYLRAARALIPQEGK